MASKHLAIDHVGQHTKFWCWAATTQMCVDFVAGSAVTQCQQANHEFTMTDCCSDPVPTACVRGGWPEFPQWGMTADHTPTGVALTWAELKSQIDADRPVPFSWRWKPFGGHMMLATGYTDAQGGLVYVNDPWPIDSGDAWVTPYANWVGGNTWQGENAVHTHWRDYYNLADASSVAAPPSKAGNSGPRGARPVFETSDQAAQSILATIDDYATVDTAEQLCVDSEEELELGDPIEVHYLLHDGLTDHSGDDPVSAILHDGEEVIYPLLRDGEIVSSIVMSLGTEGWGTKRVGSRNLTRSLIAVRDQHAAESGLDPREYVVVHLPHLYRIFVAHHEDDQLVFGHVYDDEEFGFITHDRIAASELITRLAPEIDGFVGALHGGDE